MARDNVARDMEEGEQPHIRPVVQDGAGTDDDTQRAPQADHVTFDHSEGGWGWVVCVTSMFTNGTVFGSINTFGILYVALLEQYASDDSGFQISWVGSVCSGLAFLLCMVASVLCDHFGVRRVSFTGALLAFTGMLSSAFVNDVMLYYLTYGVMMGTGFALTYNPSLVILGHYFQRRMGLVNGLVTFGSSAFTIAYALGIPVLLGEVGLKYTLLCLSGLIFFLMPYSLTWKLPYHQTPETAGLESVERQGRGGGEGEGEEGEGHSRCYVWLSRYLNLSIWRNRGYVIWVTAFAVAIFGYFVPFTHLVQHTKVTFPGSKGHLLPMFMSVTSGLSRVVFGLLADTRAVSLIRMEQTAFFLLGVCTFCIPFADSFESLIVICLAMGVCDGLIICLLGPVAYQLVGETGASQAIGFLFGIIAVPMTCGPPLAGLGYDKLGDYTVAFHAAGVPPILGALLLFLVPRHDAQALGDTPSKSTMHGDIPSKSTLRDQGTSRGSMSTCTPSTLQGSSTSESGDPVFFITHDSSPPASPLGGPPASPPASPLGGPPTCPPASPLGGPPASPPARPVTRVHSSSSAKSLARVFTRC